MLLHVRVHVSTCRAVTVNSTADLRRVMSNMLEATLVSRQRVGALKSDIQSCDIPTGCGHIEQCTSVGLEQDSEFASRFEC